MFAMAVTLAKAFVCSLLVTLLGRRVHPFSLLRDAQGLNRARATGTRRRDRPPRRADRPRRGRHRSRDRVRTRPVPADQRRCRRLGCQSADRERFLPGAGSTPERTTDFLQTSSGELPACRCDCGGRQQHDAVFRVDVFHRFRTARRSTRLVTARQIESHDYARVCRGGRPATEGRRRPMRMMPCFPSPPPGERGVRQAIPRDRPVAGRIFPGLGSHQGPTRIVGVVGSVRRTVSTAGRSRELYLSLEQGRPIRRELYVVVRTSGDS